MAHPARVGVCRNANFLYFFGDDTLSGNVAI